MNTPLSATSMRTTALKRRRSKACPPLFCISPRQRSQPGPFPVAERSENKLFPSGRGAARQARLVWVQEVVSSNLAAPTPTIFSLATLSIRRRLRRSLKMQIHPRAPEA